jgi:hypothetical protein
MIYSDASEHFAMPATEAASTTSRTDSAKPVGAQENSRFADTEAEAVCKAKTVRPKFFGMKRSAWGSDENNRSPALFF